MGHSTAVVEIPDYNFRYLVRKPRGGRPPASLGASVARKVRRFHRQLPGYTPTDLIRLHRLARSWGLAEILVKDESTRFGLKAFKVLGGSYAVARMVCEKLGITIEDLDYNHREILWHGRYPSPG